MSVACDKCTRACGDGCSKCTHVCGDDSNKCTHVLGNDCDKRTRVCNEVRVPDECRVGPLGNDIGQPSAFVFSGPRWPSTLGWDGGC